MFLDLSPLRRHRSFRYLFAGQFVSALGSFLTFVALPVQTYGLTKSSAVVGLLGVAELVPLAATALWGGAFADAADRRRLLLYSEALLLLGSAALALNALQPEPNVALIFVVAALMSAVNGFHSPALGSLTPQLVAVDDLPAVSALASLRGTTAAIAGPAIAGVCIATVGLPMTFAIDAATFALSLLALLRVSSIPPSGAIRPPGIASIGEGIRYAASRPELIGTYVVDIVALTFAMPIAVFPALAAQWGGSHAVGYLYSAMSVGGLAVTLLSGWTKNVERRGAAIVIAATLWGVSIAALGKTSSLSAAVVCLVLAGAADTVRAVSLDHLE